LQTGIRPDSIRSNGCVVTRWRCEFAPPSVLFECAAMADLMAKGGTPSSECGHEPRILTEDNFTIKMQSTGSLANVFICVQ
jgi:hypothetical protein